MVFPLKRDQIRPNLEGVLGLGGDAVVVVIGGGGDRVRWTG